MHLIPTSSNFQRTFQNLVFTSFPHLAIPPKYTTKPYQLNLAKLQCFSQNQDTFNTQFVCKLCFSKSPLKI